ncbi:penicillin binding protein PBP4B [uncultured Anaerococcus sp.]|uniref:penicillin binding protein PBP4B n=2 Tax=Anaerococcus TaxID=165779 RepID=UPI002803FFD4|nr:penicillin binding protein PBP4B [uncultured Anaerococcus sp.]
MNKKILLIAAFAFLLPFTSNADSKEESNDIVRYDYSFPRDIEEYDDSILTNSSQKFYYDDDIEDQINISNYQNADVFVNGKAVESDDEAKNLIQEGKNTVDILNVRDTVDVKIKSGKEEKGFNNSNNKLDQKVTDLMETLLDEEVKENFSGGQISVIRDNEEIYDYNFGYVNNFEKNGEAIPYEDRVEVDENTLFDLASNTKMYVTNYSLQKLVYEGKINIDDKVSKYFPEFKDDEKSPIKGKNEMTIRDILRHQAGFPADPQYHNNNYDKDDGNKNGVNDLFSQDREKTLDMVMRTPLSYEPGSKSVYSDVDYMLLGFIVEKVTGQRLDKYFAENFAKPLNLRYTLFNPLENGFDKNQVAATELNGNTRDGAVDFLNIRKDTIQGEVHDEKAYYSMAGVSGHAGLFSNSRELAKLANIMLNEGRYKNIRFWDKKTQDEFTKASEVNPSYGLGWRRMADGKYAWAFSNLASSNTIGHTGWTGTLTVIDPLERMTFVLLTNKKNGFVLNNKENPNYFYTDASMSGGYGAVSTLIYKALQDNSKELVMALANELQIGQERMLKNREGYLNEAELNDYIAIKNTNQIIKDKYKNTSEDSISIDDEKADHDNLEKTNIESAFVKSSNPKTGVSGLIPLLGLAISSAFAYRKIKR